MALQLGPLQQFFVVVPLGNHADGAHDGGVVGKDLVGRRRDVVRAAGAHGFDGSHDALLLYVANAQDFAVDLFRCGRSAAGRVHMNDDGLDGAVVAKLAKLLDHVLGREDYAFQVNHGDLVAESREGIFLLRAHGEIHQRKHRQQKQEEGTATEQHPEKDARRGCSDM